MQEREYFSKGFILNKRCNPFKISLKHNIMRLKKLSISDIHFKLKAVFKGHFMLILSFCGKFATLLTNFTCRIIKNEETGKGHETHSC